MRNNNIRVAIVDDHQIVIDGIHALLKNEKGIEITASTTSPAKMLELLNVNSADVLITDVYMPEMNGRELAKKVKEKFPQTKILALSMSGQGQTVDAMINESDIAGYVLKNLSKTELLLAIRKIHAGGIYFSEEVLQELSTFSEIKKQNDDVHLTIREIEIIQLIEKEFSNKEIADALFISERTVETHRKNIFRKTGASSLVGLVKYALLHHLIDFSDQNKK